MAFTQVPLFNDNDGLDLERLNAMVNNQSHFEENKVVMRYDAYNVVRTETMKIAVGAIDCNNANSYQRTRWITVSGFFTPGYRPVGLASLASLVNRRSTIAIANRTATSTVLDNTGMSVAVFYITPDINLLGPNYANWIMIGQ